MGVLILVGVHWRRDEGLESVSRGSVGLWSVVCDLWSLCQVLGYGLQTRDYRPLDNTNAHKSTLLD